MTINDRTELPLSDTGAGCSCCATAVTPSSDEASTNTVANEVLVSGMTCSHCVMSVTEELSALEGVEGVSVDLNAGGVSRVTVRSTAPVDAAILQAAVEEAGYGVAGVSA